MAGETEVLNYNDIDANKMLNKAGLLELSGQIKGYIQANAGGGTSYTAGDGIDITNNVISNTIAPKIISIDGNFLPVLRASGGLTAANEAYLSNLFQYGYEAYPCKILWSRTNQGYVDIPFYFLRVDTTWRKLYFWGVINPGNVDTRAINLLVFTFNSNNEITDFTSPDDGRTTFLPGPNGVRLSAYYSPSGSATGVGDAFYYIKNNYAKKAELPPIPADPSSDGTYVLQNTVSSGTATYSWGTPSGGGGGTTYTAGTGISIENGVISLNLANAEEEVF